MTIVPRLLHHPLLSINFCHPEVTEVCKAVECDRSKSLFSSKNTGCVWETNKQNFRATKAALWGKTPCYSKDVLFSLPRWIHCGVRSGIAQIRNIMWIWRLLEQCSTRQIHLWAPQQKYTEEVVVWTYNNLHHIYSNCALFLPLYCWLWKKLMLSQDMPRLTHDLVGTPQHD